MLHKSAAPPKIATTRAEIPPATLFPGEPAEADFVEAVEDPVPEPEPPVIVAVAAAAVLPPATAAVAVRAPGLDRYEAWAPW